MTRMTPARLQFIKSVERGGIPRHELVAEIEASWDAEAVLQARVTALEEVIRKMNARLFDVRFIGNKALLKPAAEPCACCNGTHHDPADSLLPCPECGEVRRK